MTGSRVTNMSGKVFFCYIKGGGNIYNFSKGGHH